MRPRYLRPALTMPQIYLYRAPIDFRKQAYGLAALVEQQLGHNPFTGALYAFTRHSAPDLGINLLIGFTKAIQNDSLVRVYAQYHRWRVCNP